MGCTPSSLQQRYHGADAMDVKAANTSPSAGGGTSSPRTWRFRKGHADKDKDKDKDKTGATAENADKPVVVTKYFISQRSSLELRFGYLTKTNNQTPLKVLLAIGRDDAQSDTLRSAAERLGYDCRVVRSRDACVESFQAAPPEVVIIDCRYPRNLDGEATCRAIRNRKSSQYTVIVALVRRSTAEKEEAAVIPYLNAGFNRWLLESTSAGLCMSELLQLEHSDVAPRLQLAAAQALFVAVERSRDAIHITDSSHTIQYVNRAGEKISGYSQRELLGRNVLELNQMEGKELMFQQLSRGREWEGTVAWPRKGPAAASASTAAITAPIATPTAGSAGGETTAAATPPPMPLACRVLPVAVTGRPPSHFVFIHEVPVPGMGKRASDSGSAYPTQRGSLHSVRRNSYDIRSVSSDGIRRQSIAKLHNLSIEAPITKVISLIATAQETSSPEVVHMLDKVVDILRTTELYSPVMKEDKVRPGDPVTSDLISALLSGNATPVNVTRRSSNDSAVSRGASSGGLRATARAGKMSAQLREVLDMGLLWEFNVFKLEKLSANRPLVYLGMNLMTHFEVPQTLGCDEATLHNWLTIIEINYHTTNTYHNSTHAADVLQACANFLDRERLRQLLEPLDEATCLIAAAAHDVDHPGKSSAFLCNAGNPLAILYNDMCVLESHHAALTFKLTLSDDRVNIFKGLERDMYKRARQSVIDMILATDMTKHFEHLAKFVNVFAKPTTRDEDPATEVGSDSADMNNFLTAPENIAVVKRMLIKCADVSNPARPLRLCVEWARRIAEEYFSQTDEEKAANLPVMMPMFDRTTCSIPKSQIGFMDFIINDMFEAWEAFIEMPELMNYIETNYRFWQEKEAQGVTTIADLKMEPCSIDLVEEDGEGSVSAS
ncbi:high affinity cAMP-specific and IBMX-insensitive 3',5'-cyclic phosphodiesterase 8A isoform X1 [Schistocerca nitens]|uniref:high affinity cAMP-specific and IBMX-insensitive 3',5'-cyclic phosphodiesterase 8A isoform X1 n=1 Tax=Schistocerca nitens TaxID=7011 RepID=UPI002117628E|nr:high affinity cAMP-specific and IBMX-insensitive 3',5'-cyclic phosphodiesterase 8A isoform X1 [Schistocerca nitens]